MSQPRLWVCHECERIGQQNEAAQHVTRTGHVVEELSQEVSDGVRAEWARQQAQRVVAYQQLAKSRVR